MYLYTHCVNYNNDNTVAEMGFEMQFKTLFLTRKSSEIKIPANISNRSNEPLTKLTSSSKITIRNFVTQ